MTRRLAIVALLLCACNDVPAPPNEGGSSSGSTGTGGTGSSSSSGADSSTGTPMPETVFDVQLELELVHDVRVTVTTVGASASATVVPERGYGLVADGTTLEGVARIDRYPEIGATVYTARFDGAAVAGGPCGDAPVGLALSLHLDDDDRVIAGGLTGYCDGAFAGVPAIEPLRIFGRLP
ncbi:MAG: hypothetical protein K1X88_23900 [Nannocystaceae bacterium]|nr:hypothetical protein [Nannocystaceae bacterium]